MIEKRIAIFQGGEQTNAISWIVWMLDIFLYIIFKKVLKKVVLLLKIWHNKRCQLPNLYIIQISGNW